MVPVSPTSATGYAYQMTPRPFFRAHAPLAETGTDPAQAFGDPARAFGDPAQAFVSPASVQEYYQSNPYWNNLQPIQLQQTMGQRPFMSTPIYGPTGFVDGQIYQGILCCYMKRMLFVLNILFFVTDSLSVSFLFFFPFLLFPVVFLFFNADIC